MPDITLTAEERAFLYFIPPALGGKAPPEAMQQKFEALGLASAPQADGRRQITILGDQVRRGSVKVKIEG